MALVDLEKAAINASIDAGCGLISSLYDECLKELGALVKEKIPGQVDDVVIDLVVGTGGPMLKDLMLKKLAGLKKV